MLTKEKLIRNTSYDFALPTNKKVVERPLVEFDKPFWGADKKAYIMAKYPERLMKTTNCYAFAFGWRIPGEMGEDFNPGSLSGLPYSLENLPKMVEADLAVVGRKVYEVLYDIPEELPASEGYWIKAVRVGEKDSDIHFMVKDPKSGRWFHKVGWESPPKIVTRNLELLSDVDYTLREKPEYRELPRELIEQMILMAFGEIRMNIVSCIVETTDNAEYRMFNPEKNPNDYIICPNVCAMRISK